MEKNKRNVKILSILLFVMAAIEVVNLLMTWIGGGFQNAAELEGAPGKVVAASIILTIFFAAVIIGAEVFLGVKGMHQVQGRPVRSHIFISKVVLVFMVLVLISEAPSVVNGEGETASFCSTIASGIILYLYSRFTKALSQQE